MAQPRLGAGVDLPGWKTMAAAGCAALLALLFIVAGVWKITDPHGAAARMVQAQIPPALGLPCAILLGIGETFAGVLLVVPRFRRWGAWLTGLMLVAFLIYIAAMYDVLRGEECNCFPWIQRAVGPGFFIGDLVMLAMAAVAGLWARRSEGLKSAALILAAVTVFALVSFGASAARQTGTKAPSPITVDGKSVSLEHGKVFLYFYDPECSHCDEAARAMGKWNWRDTRVITLATRMPQFAQDFMTSTGMKGGMSPDWKVLKEAFPFGDSPYGVALDHGRQVAALAVFDKTEPARTLRALNFIE